VAQCNLALRKVGFILFSIAILLGIILTLLRAIPDLEATMYGFIKYGYPRIYSLICPVLMTTQDREPVSIRLHNNLDRNLNYYIETQFSSPILIISSDQNLVLAPGESKVLAWEVGEENIDLGNFIFARVFTSAATTNGFHESTCGTVVINLPFAGGPAIYFSALVLSVFGAGVGFWLWSKHSVKSDPEVLSRFWWMRLMVVVVVIGIVTALIGFWFVAFLMVALAVLATGVMLIPRKV
jgi:hypothetical protein